MEETINLSFSDKLYFPEIEFEEYDDKILVISPATANWIVLDSEKEKEIFQVLIASPTIGDAYKLFEHNEIDKVLAKIISRKFAGINEKIISNVISTSNLMCCYLTTACNLKCPHCYMSAGVKSKNELTIDEWKNILLDFKMNGGIGVTFTGGEPLMNKDFSDIIKYSNSIGLSVTILSNGLLWSDKMIDELYNCIDEIQFSIDGVDDESNSLLRGKSHFTKVKDTAILFSKKGVRVSIATTFTLDGLNDDIKNKYKNFVENIHKEAKDIIFKLSKKIIDGRSIHYSEKQNSEFHDKIIDIERSINQNSTIECFIEDHFIFNNLLNNCGFGGITISSTGDVYFCNRISELSSIGNIRNNSIKYFLEEGHKIKEMTSVDNVEPCKHCNIRYICGGGCRIDDFNFHGKSNDYDNFTQIKCNNEKVHNIKKQMIDSFLYYYEF